MKHLSWPSLLFSSVALLAPILAASSAAAQEIIPFGLETELDLDCVYDPVVFESEDRTIGLWWRRSAGIFARSGASLEELGPVVQLNQELVERAVAVAPLPGGFAAAWTRFPAAQPPEVVLQRFGGDLSPTFPAVIAGTASPLPSPALLADPDGSQLVLAYYDAAGTLQIVRYSSAGAPLGPAIAADPTILVGQRGGIRLVAGENGFLAVWSGLRAGEYPYLWARAFGWDGQPAAAAMPVVSADTADFDVAWAAGHYLMVTPGGFIRGYRLDEDGQYLDEPFQIRADDAHHPRLAAGDGVLWLTYIDGPVLGRRIELPSFTADSLPEVLVPRPENNQRYIARGSVSPRAGGFLAAWQMAPVNVILHPCMDTDSIYAQAFGPPRGVVDVPVLAPPGLLALTLLLAAGGLLLLRG